MLSQEDIVLPSSPLFPDKSFWEKSLRDFATLERSQICPDSLSKERTPRTEDVLQVSMLRQVHLSPIIKQESDCGFSQPDYVYTSAAEGTSGGHAIHSLFSTPKFPDWDALWEGITNNSLDKTRPQSPIDSPELPENDVIPSPGDKGAMMRVVEVLQPVPIRKHAPVINDTRKRKDREKSSYFVTIKITKRKSFLGVINYSGPDKEYRLPVFAKLKPLKMMIESGKYHMGISDGRSIDTDSAKNTKKRYDSRLTRQQLAFVLGVEGYDISLVKDLESIILDMCTQLCGLKIGESSWSRSVSQKLRKASVAKVYKFAKLYFPSFTMDNILTIIKRGAYTRTQEFLRRRRRRERKYANMNSLPSETSPN
ncbi:hypothetical protein OXX59_005182 [Metschnikowia pulcherrima]